MTQNGFLRTQYTELLIQRNLCMCFCGLKNIAFCMVIYYQTMLHSNSDLLLIYLHLGSTYLGLLCAFEMRIFTIFEKLTFQKF